MVARSFKYNFVWNSSYQVVRILLPLVTTPYLARVLGSEQMGIYSYTFAIANFTHLLCLLGLNQYGNREIAKVRDNREELSKTFWSIFVMQLMVGVVVSLAYLIYALFLSEEMALYSLIWIVWVGAEAFNVGWFFFGLEEFKTMTIRNLLVRLFVIIGIFTFVRTEEDLGAYCLLQALSFFISNAALLPMLAKRIDFYRPSFSEVRKHVLPNLRLFAPIIAITLYTQLNKVFLGAVSNMSEVAFFDNADKIARIPVAVIQSLGVVMLPRMSRVRVSGDGVSAKRYFDQSIWLATILAFGFAFGISAISPEFIPLFFGPGYEKCSILVPMSALLLPAIAWSNAFGVQWLIPAERDGEYLKTIVLGALVNVILCVMLVPSLQSIGAGIASVCTEATVTVSQAYRVRRELSVKKYVIDAIPYACIGLIMLVAVRFVACLLPASVFGVLLEVLVGAGVYLAGSIGFLLLARDRRLCLFFRR